MGCVRSGACSWEGGSTLCVGLFLAMGSASVFPFVPTWHGLLYQPVRIVTGFADPHLGQACICHLFIQCFLLPFTVLPGGMELSKRVHPE